MENFKETPNEKTKKPTIEPNQEIPTPEQEEEEQDKKIVQMIIEDGTEVNQDNVFQSNPSMVEQDQSATSMVQPDDSNSGIVLVSQPIGLEKDQEAPLDSTTTLHYYCSQTPIYAIDVECVGAYKKSIPGRVSVVDQFGETVYDSFIKPVTNVIDYRTRYSGIRPFDLLDAPPICQVLIELKKILLGSIVIGHAIENDLRYLGIQLDHYYDTQMLDEYCSIFSHPPRLKELVKIYFGVNIQNSCHDSRIDAYYTMALFKNKYNVLRNYNITRHFFSDGTMCCNCGKCVTPKIPFTEKKKNKFVLFC